MTDTEQTKTSEPVAWQRRAACVEARQYQPGDWLPCGRAEATDAFERWPGFEYRALYAAPVATPSHTALEALRESYEAQIATLPRARHFEILVEAMAEVKAVSDGKSDQPLADIVQGCLDEIAALPDLASQEPRQQEERT